jgi:hypothetical protein
MKKEKNIQTNSIGNVENNPKGTKTAKYGILIIIAIPLIIVSVTGVPFLLPVAAILIIMAFVGMRKEKKAAEQQALVDGVASPTPPALKENNNSDKCKRCGKGGPFNKINESGFCKKCEQIGLAEALEALRSEYTNWENALHKLQADYDNLYNEIANKAKRDIQSELQSVIKEIEEKRKEIIFLDETIKLESFAFYQSRFAFETSDEYKQKRDEVREKQKALMKADMAALAGQGWTLNGSLSEGKKMMDDMKKLLVRSFNNECDSCMENVKFNNIEAQEKRIEKSFEALNKLGAIMKTSITAEYKKLKCDELYLTYEMQKKKQEEKEEAKRAKERLREQQKLEKELKEAREKIAKEKKHFTAAIQDLETKLQIASNEDDRALIIQNLEEVKSHYEELNKEESVVDYREQNAKAGYVYIISNIGSFGEGVYKIGMTRRLEPMERVEELGDASVPFGFDVHALIFSENAPELEAQLHQYFYDCRINRLNDRKEFYKADINEIEKVIKESYNKAVDIVKDAPAEQYRESLLLASE